MKTEILLYCYGAVCMSMILFNFLSVFAFKDRESRELKQELGFKKQIDCHLLLLSQGEMPSEKELGFLERRLRHIGNLRSFDLTLSEYARKDPEAIKKYITVLHGVFLRLSAVYIKKEDIQSAYFLSFINKHGVGKGEKFDALVGAVMEYFKKPLIYCALNAMDTLILSGQPENVIRGLKALCRRDTYLYTKLISMQLCSFEGDVEGLALAMKDEFGTVPVGFQTAFIDYFSAVDKNREFVLSVLCDEQRDDEARYSAIRYFGKHPSDEAYPKLCEFASCKSELDWIYASQAAAALASYPDERTVPILKRALFSSNYYVRYNAITSLDKLGVSYNELSDILRGNDRYAKEMVTYQTEHRGLKERQVAGV